MELLPIVATLPTVSDPLPPKRAGGGRPSKKGRKSKVKPAPAKVEEPKEEDVSALVAPKKRVQITPEVIFKIKEMLTEGEKVTAIVEATGVSAPTVYKFKTDLNL